MSEEKHRWLFESYAVGLVDVDGLGVHAEQYFVGTKRQAIAEADRRAELAEEKQCAYGIMKAVGHGLVV